MSRGTRIAVVSVALACALAPSALAQKATGQSAEASRARGLFVDGRSDAMRIKIIKAEGGVESPVDPSRVFKSGESIRLAFEANFDGFVYVVNVTPGGATKVLFPDAVDGNNTVVARKEYTVPGAGRMFTFDQETGVETLQVIMSRKPIAHYDEAIKKSAGEVGKTAESAAAELATGGPVSQQIGIVAENVAIALPQGVPKEIRARKVILAAGRDNDKEGSVVAIPDEKKSSPKLQDNEVAVVEIRLKHM